MADLQIKVTCTLPSPQGGGGGGEGTATRRVRLSTEHCQRFFINATPKLVTKLQATLIQHSLTDWFNIPIESSNFQVLARA